MYIRWLIFSCDLLSLYPAAHFLSMWFSGIIIIIIIIIIILYFWQFFIQELADRFSLKSEWQQVLSSFQDSS